MSYTTLNAKRKKRKESKKKTMRICDANKGVYTNTMMEISIIVIVVVVNIIASNTFIHIWSYSKWFILIYIKRTQSIRLLCIYNMSSKYSRLKQWKKNIVFTTFSLCPSISVSANSHPRFARAQYKTPALPFCSNHTSSHLLCVCLSLYLSVCPCNSL